MEDPAASRPGESRELPRQALGRIPVWACVLGGAGLLALLMIVLLLMGRPAWCECGYVKIWHGDVMSSENSQHIADWYTFTHVIHGFGLYGVLWLVGRRWSLELRFLLALLIEVAWEIFENTDFVIERYREHHRPRLLRRQRDQFGGRRPCLHPGFCPGRPPAGLGDGRSCGRDRGGPRLRDPGQFHAQHHHADLPVRGDQAVAARSLTRPPRRGEQHQGSRAARLGPDRMPCTFPVPATCRAFLPPPSVVPINCRTAFQGGLPCFT